MKKQFSTALSLMTFLLGMSSATASVDTNTAVKLNIMNQSSAQHGITDTNSAPSWWHELCPREPGDSRGDPCFDFRS